MKHIGWLVNGTYFKVSERARVIAIIEHRPMTNIVELYAKEEPCVTYS